MRLLTLAILLAAHLAIWLQPASLEAADCQFVLGFQALHSFIPDTVGNCVDDEQHDASTGDGSQSTTNGILVWRKAENFTAFTDGIRTWINGPGGIQMRLNNARFSWETLTIDSLENATYQFVGDNAPATLRRGKFEKKFDPLRGSYVLVALEESTATFGDIYGNGGDGAAVVASVNLGGSGIFKYLEVIVSVLGRPTYVANAYLGDRVKINNITIRAGSIRVDMLTQGPDAGLCCPNVQVVQVYQLQGNQLTRLS